MLGDELPHFFQQIKIKPPFIPMRLKIGHVILKIMSNNYFCVPAFFEENEMLFLVNFLLLVE